MKRPIWTSPPPYVHENGHVINIHCTILIHISREGLGAESRQHITALGIGTSPHALGLEAGALLHLNARSTQATRTLWMRYTEQVPPTGNVIIVGLEQARPIFNERAAAVPVVNCASLVGRCVIEEYAIRNRRRAVVVVDGTAVERRDVQCKVALSEYWLNLRLAL